MMGVEKRKKCRINATGPVFLTEPNYAKISAALMDISLSGMLISDLSDLLDPSIEYKIELFSPSGESIYLSGRPVWNSGNKVGFSFSRYRFHSHDLLESLMTDIKVSHDLLALLDEEHFDDAIKGYQETVEKDIFDDADG